MFPGGKSWAYTWVSLKGWALFLRCSVPDTVTLSIDASLINLQAIRTQHFTNITCHLHKWFEVGLTTRKEQCTAGQVLLALHLITSFPRSCCHMYVYSRPISARSKNKFCLTFGNFFFFGVSSCPFLESFDWLVCARYLSLKMSPTRSALDMIFFKNDLIFTLEFVPHSHCEQIMTIVRVERQTTTFSISIFYSLCSLLSLNENIRFYALRSEVWRRD